jgi:hypothetical protein
MKTTNKAFILALLLLTYVTISGFYFSTDADKNTLTGAWQLQSNDHEEVLLFADNYFSHTAYSKKNKKFEFTRGGTCELKQDKAAVTIEFDTRQKDEVGKTLTYDISLQDSKLVLNINGKNETWRQLDKGTDNLSGTWRITARKQEGEVVPIHQTGTRKTVKILTATRFQWAAINPGTKEFFGTGGGSYTFNNGKYTENIEFFSRDSSRVGASLTFDGSLKNGDWHHSGLSSKGDSIYEVWSRIK